ncbi:MAG: hypothetical protein KGL67_00795 [Patescibacteria group bacterium]|nr:hypothetical protein [Patescibacteria group bacterium]
MNLKIATYNIKHGLKLAKIIENMQELSASGVMVFCLQEMRESNKKEPSVLGACLKALGEGWEHETFLEPHSINFGLCFIWRADVLKVKKLEKLVLPKIPKFNIRVIAKKIKKIIDRGALIGTFEMNGKLIRISNIHLDCHGQFAQRERQLKALVDYLKSNSSIDKEIICGDFNTIGMEALSKKQEKKILDILGPNFINAHPRSTPTFHLLQRLDYIFVKNIKVKKAEVLKLKGSDHRPIIASLEI